MSVASRIVTPAIDPTKNVLDLVAAQAELRDEQCMAGVERVSILTLAAVANG
jgi:hypothetical protein